MLSLFFFNDTATTEIYTLSLHDALPIFSALARVPARVGYATQRRGPLLTHTLHVPDWRMLRHEVFYYLRSEEHTSELQSRSDLVCRLLLEKKKKRHIVQPGCAQQELCLI